MIKSVPKPKKKKSAEQAQNVLLRDFVSLEKLQL